MRALASVLVPCVVVLGVLTLGARHAHADKVPGPESLPVAIVSVKSDDALDQAEALTDALKRAVLHSQGWSLAPGKTQSLEFLALKMKCSEPIDSACELRIAEVIGAERYLWTVIRLADGGNMVEGTLNFFVKGQGTRKADLRYSANLTDAQSDALFDVAVEAVSQATGGPPKGGLRIATGGVAGQLFVDDNPFGALAAAGGTFQLTAGAHRVVVKAPGHADAAQTVKVLPGQTVDLNVTMVKVETVDGVDGRMIGGFVGLGVGVAAGAVGLWAALEVNGVRSDDGFNLYREGFTANENACDAARAGTVATNVPGASSPQTVADMCDKADTLEVVQAVTFPVAAVAAGVGAYLLGTSSLAGGSDQTEQSARRWTIQADIGPQVQAVGVRCEF